MGANRVSVLPDQTQCLLMLMGWLQQIHLEYLELKGTVMVQRIKFCSKKKHLKRQLRGTPPPPLAHGVHGITPHGWKGAQCIF